MQTVFLATFLFSRGAWLWTAVLAAAVLVPLAWLATRPAAGRWTSIVPGLVLRTLGITLVLLCLLEPQWVSSRAKRGANTLVLLADNSQGLQVKEENATLSRADEMKAMLADIRSLWLNTLSDEFQLRSYVFDRQLRRVQDFAALDFQGDRTSLGRALKEIRERFTGQPLAGVLLFTDGNATDVANGLPDLTGLPPIYPVVIGKPDHLRDIRLERTDVRQTAFDDSPVTLRATVGAHRADGVRVEVKVAPLALVNQPVDKTAAQEIPPPQVVRSQNGTVADATFRWHPSGTGVQFYEVTAEPRGLAGNEATTLNNRRRVLIDRGRPAYRIMYVGGRPNWEYKFLNRSLSDDPQLQMVGLIRVARREPKFEFKGHAGEAANPLFRGFGRAEDETARYDQPVMVRVAARDENELRGGFPATPEELFAYDAIILDDIEASFFTHDQLELLRRFAAERGGGLLMLGGPDTFDHGGYAGTPLATALPLHLDRPAKAKPEGELTWKLTREGWVEPWMRVRAVESDEAERLASMPKFQVMNPLDSIKPGATALATVEDQAGHIYPALVSQRYGAGRVACITVGDIWRWGMRGENDQPDVARFWRQLTRWLVTDAPPRISVQVEPAPDGEGVRLHAVAKDRAFRPLDAARVTFTVTRHDEKPAPGPGPAFATVSLPGEPINDRPGEFVATLSLRDAGAYVVEADVFDNAGQSAGHAEAGWVSDPLAEEFASLEPNRALLEEIARRTKGEVIAQTELDKFAERLPKRAAPIMESRAWPLWQQSWVLLAVLGCFLAEWFLRRKKGLP